MTSAQLILRDASGFIGSIGDVLLQHYSSTRRRAPKPPSTGLFVSTDKKLGDESELFSKLEK